MAPRDNPRIVIPTIEASDRYVKMRAKVMSLILAHQRILTYEDTLVRAL